MRTKAREGDREREREGALFVIFSVVGTPTLKVRNKCKNERLGNV